MSRGRAEARSRRKRRTRSRMRASRARSSPARSADADRLDLVPDLDAGDDVNAGRHLTEVRVLLVEERCVLLHDQELGIVVERWILTARDTGCAELEAEVGVLGRHAYD